MASSALKLWVMKQGGIDQVAKLLKVKPITVYKWLQGNHVPRTDTIWKIVKLSKKKLSCEKIILETSANLKSTAKAT